MHKASYQLLKNIANEKKFFEGCEKLWKKSVFLKLGVVEKSIERFIKGETITFEFISKTKGYVSGFMTKQTDEIQSYIFYIKDEGGAATKSFLEYRQNSINIANCFGIKYVELVGSTIINPKILELVKRQGFEKKIIDVPSSLGEKPGEKMELFVKQFKIE